MSGTATTVAEVLAILAVTAVVKVKVRLSNTATGEGTIVGIAGTGVAKLNTVEGLLLLTTDRGLLLNSTLEVWKMSRLALGGAEAVSGRSLDRVAKASLARSIDAQTRSAETSRVGARGLGERTVRSCGSGIRTALVGSAAVGDTITDRAPFSCGDSSDNSCECESLEHLA